MPLHEYDDLFIDSRGRPRAHVPDSCIESAEYIMQCIYYGQRLGWSRGSSQTPHVWAHFGNCSINISDEEDFQNNIPHLVDYPFRRTLKIGQGLILLNNTNRDLSYNMHLGAVVGIYTDGSLKLSNMMEPEGDVGLEILQTIRTTPRDFAADTFGSRERYYAIGKLTLSSRG